MEQGTAIAAKSDQPHGAALRARAWTRMGSGLMVTAMLGWQMRQHLNLLAFPWPLDYRENVVLYRGVLVASGHSPYDFLPFSQSQYGFVTDYLSAPLILLFGTGFAAPRAVAAIAILLSSLLLALYAVRRTQDRLLGFLVFTLGYISSFSHPQIALASPNALGGLLFMVSVIVPLLASFSIASLGLALVAGLLGFFTKLYPGIGPVFVLACLLASRDWMKSAWFALAGAAALGMSLLAVSHFFPNYFGTTLGIAHAALGWDGAWLLVQGTYFLTLQLPLLVFLAWCFWHLPAGQRRALLAGSSGICALIAVVVLLKIGGNKLQYYLYFYQLLFPFLLLLALDAVGQEWRARRNLLICLLANIALMFLVAQQHTPLTRVDASFRAIAARLPEGDLSHVLLDPPAGFFAIMRGQTPPDDGQTEFLRDALGAPHTLFVANAAMIEARKRAGLYDLILTDGLQPSQDHTDLSRCYRLSENRSLRLYELSTPFQVWVRKPC